MFYLDTSVLVSALTPEIHTEIAQTWLAQNHDRPLAISDWTIAEFSSALSIKRRSIQMPDADYESAAAMFQKLRASAFELLPVERSCFADAAQLCEQTEFALRSGDALHLAVARLHGATIVTFDKQFTKAAGAVGTGYQQL